MTQQHPNVLGALSALADLVDQYQWFADLLEPGRRQRTARPSLTPAARAVLDRQAKAERRDQVETLRRGLKPSGASAAPLVVDVLQAQMDALGAVMHAAWLATDALATTPVVGLRPYTGGGAADTDRFQVAVGYLEDAIRHLPTALAGVIGVDLNSAARTCQLVTGYAPDRRDFRHGPCPACGRDSLVVQTTGTEQPALIQCGRPDCKCRGYDCLCKRPVREPGMRHLWPSDEFEHLKKRLGNAA